MKKIAIASGKGGTGKTTFAVNLAFAENAPVHLLDCDVEEPNCHLFFSLGEKKAESFSTFIPQLDSSLCTACGQCAKICQYKSISLIQDKILFFPEMCHGCKACMLVCPVQAVRPGRRRRGTITTGVQKNVRLTYGTLDIGEAMAPPLIRAVLGNAESKRHVIIDSPPGTSCPMIAAVRGADAAVLVTEPTPFGLYDLKLAVKTVRQISVPLGVIINRSNLGDREVYDYCSSENIPILMEMPNDIRIAQACSKGRLVLEALPEYRILFERTLEKINELERVK